MKKIILYLLLVLPVACWLTACGSDDDEEESESESVVTVSLTSANLTEDGYFDGVLYYKITSNSPLEVCVSKAEKSAVKVEIPKKIYIDENKYDCTSIGENAFNDCSNLISITIPNSVKVFGYGAFLWCNKLKAVYISDLATWCNSSFAERTSNPLAFAHHLFLNDVEIKELNIPNNVTKIGERVFYGCNSLTSVSIPNSVSSIGEAAFYGCSGLTSLKFGNNVTNIGSFAFYECSGLTSIVIPNSVTVIDDYVFGYCSGLTSINIPNSVTYIGCGAFGYCSNLSFIGSTRNCVGKA